MKTHCWASQQWHPRGKTRTTALRGTDARLFHFGCSPHPGPLPTLRGEGEIHTGEASGTHEITRLGGKLTRQKGHWQVVRGEVLSRLICC